MFPYDERKIDIAAEYLMCNVQRLYLFKEDIEILIYIWFKINLRVPRKGIYLNLDAYNYAKYQMIITEYYEIES